MDNLVLSYIDKSWDSFAKCQSAAAFNKIVQFSACFRKLGLVFCDLILIEIYDFALVEISRLLCSEYISVPFKGLFFKERICSLEESFLNYNPGKYVKETDYPAKITSKVAGIFDISICIQATPSRRSRGKIILKTPLSRNELSSSQHHCRSLYLYKSGFKIYWSIQEQFK